MRLAALCVGIDLYAFGSLQGCVSDAERMAALLAKHDDVAHPTSIVTR